MRKVVTASALALVLSAAVPAHLLAADREDPATLRAAGMAEWLSILWHDLAALFAADTTPPRTGSGGGPTTQGSCAVDPNGGCYGG
jgi:hypothetical protein